MDLTLPNEQIERQQKIDFDWAAWGIQLIPGRFSSRYQRTVKPVLIVAGLCALLCGCMGVKHEEYYWAHFGPYPTNYHELVTGWVEKNYDEPRSVTISSPVRVRLPKPLLSNGEKVYGWCAGIGFESKGTFDTYTPRQFHHVYMRDGKIITAIENDMEQPRSRGIAQVPYFE